MKSRRAASPWFALAVLTAGPLIAATSFASHFTVRPDGSGDFPTVTAAVQFMSSSALAETLILEPGFYDEVVDDRDCFQWLIYGRAGAESTHVAGFTSTGRGSCGGKVVGLTVIAPVTAGEGTYSLFWEHCVFAGGFIASTGWYQSAGPIPRYCTFRGPSSFRGYNDIYDCIFESAPVFFENEIGYVKATRCTFRGPAGELVLAHPRDQSGIVFEDCEFSDADLAIRLTSYDMPHELIEVRDCRFERISGSAIEYLYDGPAMLGYGHFRISIEGTRFSTVGQAVKARTSTKLHLFMDDDTIATTTGIAVDAATQQAGLSRLHVTGANQGSIRLDIQNHDPARHTEYLPVSVDITDCRLSSGSGDGIHIAQLANPLWNLEQSTSIRNSTVEHHEGSGIVVAGPNVAVKGCVLSGNSAHGLLVTIMDGPQSQAAVAAISGNTAVENRGRGIFVKGKPTVSSLTIDHNLTTHNGGGGLVVLAGRSASISSNNSWANHGPEYQGFAAGHDNLIVDPLYCMQSAGDFELRPSSPCAPSGPYGQIGALGVGCSESAAMMRQARIQLGPLATPNPSRGTVVFSWAGTAPLDELAIFDVQGRLRWRASASSLLAGAPRWDGRDDSGARLPPGVYLARWRQGERAGTARLIRLGD